MELGSGGEEEAALEAASGVESTNSEVSCLFKGEVKFQNVDHQVSWEAVEEGETRPTLWVPDHAASQVSPALQELGEQQLSKNIFLRGSLRKFEEHISLTRQLFLI